MSIEVNGLHFSPNGRAPQVGFFCLFLLLAAIADHASAQDVPATLDLVDNARYSQNALNGTSDDRGEFMFDCTISPPSITHDAYSFSACGPKYIESMAMASLMSGVSIDEAGNRRSVNYLLSCLGSDGLFYCKIGPDRPWDTASPEDWANIYGQGRMLRAMLAMHQLDGDDHWVDRMRRLVATLERIAVRKKDPATGETFAYYPTTPGYGDIFSYPKSGWKTTELLTKMEPGEIGQSYADVPDHSFGIPLYLGGVIEPLVRYATSYDDPDALKLAGELTRFVVKKESGWMPDGHAQGVIPEQNAQYYGHFHGHTLALRGILEYAIATNDPQLKDFARAGYEYSRTMGIPRIGWFEEYTGKGTHETCGLVNMTALAVKLSTSGIGDYWDDVDCYARNHLTECQFTSLERLEEANGDRKLTDDDKKILQRLVGTFAGWGTPESLDDKQIMNCCTANGTQGLYYVWDSIVRTKGDTTYVNLLLNRRAPEVDVASWLPYQGKVELSVKKAGRLAVRVPGWVDKDDVKLALNGSESNPTFVEQYVILDKVEPGDKVGLTFPVRKSVENYAFDAYEMRGTKYLGRKNYHITFLGNTAVDIEPKAKSGYAVYSTRPKEGAKIPLKPQDSYTADKRISW